MKAIQFFTLFIFTSVLMGCQIEVTPLEGNDTNIQQSSTTTDDADDTDTGTDTGTDNEPSVQTSTVTLYWTAPSERMNGNDMALEEIGGYEIRYKKESDSDYTNVLISDASIEQHSVTELEDAETYTFEVAAFDTNGVYSEFVLASAN